MFNDACHTRILSSVQTPLEGMEKEGLTLLILGAEALNFLLLLDEVVASRGMMQKVAPGGRIHVGG